MVLSSECLPHHTSPHSCVWPSSRAPTSTHSLSPLSRAQEQRRDTSPSSFDGRTPRAPPSRTRGLGHHTPFPQPTTLQLSEFEEPLSLPLIPNISGVRRQRSHAGLYRTQTISGSRSFYPLQRHLNPHHPSTTIDQLAEHHTDLLTDLEVSLPQHQTTIFALRQQFEAHIRFLRINLESYIALQLSITGALHEHHSPADPVQATAYPLPPEPFDTSHTSRQGRFRFYAVRRGRTTGIFNCWEDCHRSVNRTPNEYREFGELR